ncbi:ribosomal RNA processing protein 36 homolog isoform X2 [Dysidea avara]
MMGKVQRQQPRPKRRRNKHRPLELSSKHPPPRLPASTNKKPKGSRDPRFDRRTGAFNDNLFKKSFSFLDDMKQNERKVLVGAIKKAHGQKKENLTSLLTRMDDREATEQKRKEKQVVVREHNRAQRENVKKGKKAFYFKSAVKKRVELVEKYRQLKKEGNFTKYLEKKRGRTARRDHVKLPFRRWSRFES